MRMLVKNILKNIQKTFFTVNKKMSFPFTPLGPSPRLWQPETSPPLKTFFTHVDTGKNYLPPL